MTPMNHEYDPSADFGLELELEYEVTLSVCEPPPGVNLIFCEDWDGEEQEPVGVMRDLGTYLEEDLLAAYTQANLDYLFHDSRLWGRGLIVVTDMLGTRLDPETLSMHTGQ